MKKFDYQKSRRVLLIVTMLIAYVTAWAYDIAVENAEGIFVFYNYINNGQELELTYYSEENRSLTNYVGDIIIPEDVFYENKTLKVTSIGHDAFYECKKLTSIKFPKELRSIGDRAFCGCEELTFVSLPNNLDSIGESAFQNSKIAELYIPASVDYIGRSAFSGCVELTHIDVDAANKNYDSRNDCNAIIETVTNSLIAGCKTSTIPNGIQALAWAFSGCVGLTSINIPNSVTMIVGAFSGCTGLTSVKIPGSITDIGYYSFSGCTSLSSIVIPNSVKSIGDNAFSRCSNLSSIEIPNSITSIGTYAFEQCNSLTSIKIPGSVSHIGYWAFYACHGLLDVEFENGFRDVGEYMFCHCTNLKSVKIPNSITSIGRGAFEGCYELSEVFCFAEKVPETGSDAFNGVFPVIGNNTTLHVPANSVEKYKNTIPWNGFGSIIALTDEELGNNDGPTPPDIKTDNTIEGLYQTKAESYRNYNGNSVAYGRDFEILIVDNGDGTFFVDDLFGGWYSQRAGYGTQYAMTGTISVAADGTVALIDSHVAGWGDELIALSGTYDAANSTFTIDAEYISGMLFHQTWTKNTQLIKKDGINFRVNDDNTVSVYKGKYSGDVVIPNQITYDGFTFKVNSIVEDTFNGCPDLTSVTLPDGVTAIKNIFCNCENLVSVSIPNSVTTIGGFVDCGITSIEIPNNVISLGGFSRCKNLKEIIIPNNVVSIEDNSFCENDNITKLTLSENLTTIGYYSFVNNRSLKSLFIPKSLITIKDLVFTGCESLESIIVEEGNMKFDSRNNCNAIIERYVNRLVLGCKTTIIPQDVTLIGSNAFEGCCNLINIDIPNSVTNIDGAAFYGCKSLKSFTAGSNVESMGGILFYDCEALESIILPQSLQSIGVNLFEGSINLHDVYCYAETTPLTIHPDYYFDSTNLETATLHVPIAAIEEYKQTIPWNAFGNIVALNDDDPKPTGIQSNTIASTIYPVEYYTIDGVKSSGPHKGLNIIRMSNGEIKKKYVR